MGYLDGLAATGQTLYSTLVAASFVTIAKANRADDLEVMSQTKHQITAMIQRYSRHRNIRKHNASGKSEL